MGHYSGATEGDKSANCKENGYDKQVDQLLERQGGGQFAEDQTWGEQVHVQQGDVLLSTAIEVSLSGGYEPKKADDDHLHSGLEGEE